MSKIFRKRLKNKLAALGGAAILMTGLAQAQPNIRTTLNGNYLNFDQPPAMQNGRVLVPLRGIFESLGADVLYTPATKSIKATSASGKVVELALGRREASIDGRTVYLDVPADTISGRTMVPLRFVSEAMGADVKWQSAAKTVAIEYDSNLTDVSQGDSNITIPDNDNQVAERPTINKIVHNARRNLLLGDTLTVTAVGEPGAQARFSILGAINDVQMNEVSPGRYEGGLRATPGLQVNEGTLVVYLKKNGLETIEEADRPITIAADSSSNGNGNAVSNLSPQPGQQLYTNQPNISVTFAESIRPDTATLILNGQSYRPQVSSDSRTVTMTPNYNLAPGSQNVEVQALAQDGRLLRRDWSFQVANQATSNNGQASISVSNLNSGMSVPAVFNVQGRTQPYTKVTVKGESSRSLVPGIIGVRGREFSTSTVSDGQGQFNVQIDSNNIPSDSRIDLEVSAVDGSGQVTDTVDMYVRRQ